MPLGGGGGGVTLEYLGGGGGGGLGLTREIHVWVSLKKVAWFSGCVRYNAPTTIL